MNLDNNIYLESLNQEICELKKNEIIYRAALLTAQSENEELKKEIEELKTSSEE